MAQMDLPLPEITMENFLRAWTRFELVAAAKEWNVRKRAIVLPTLLRGKLLDIYIELGEDTRADLAEVKKTLMSKVGLTKDPLVARKEFIVRVQWEDETDCERICCRPKVIIQSSISVGRADSWDFATAIPHGVTTILKSSVTVTWETHISRTSY